MNCYGAEGFRLGKFFPRLEIDEQAMTTWAARDVGTMPACHECPVASLCGGGCARLVVNRGGDLTRDVVCPPMARIPDLQVLVDHYLPLIMQKRRGAADQGRIWTPTGIAHES